MVNRTIIPTPRFGPTAVAAFVFAGFICARANCEDRLALAPEVKVFNSMVARTNQIGKSQPELTEDEVVASIRGWIREQMIVPDETYAQYLKIADTRTLPQRAKFEYLSEWGYKGYQFKGWIVYLTLAPGTPREYRYPLRIRRISCVPSGDRVAPSR